ncbi:FkbM family methyltransferase [bacterium]|nr:FkbM family methyltransferase [bacterium]
MGIGEGGNVYMSGEVGAIEHSKSILENRFPGQPLIIFDVGANVGNFSVKLKSIFSVTNVQILAFEPSPKSFTALSEKFSDGGVQLFNIGFSNEKGLMKLNSNYEGSEISSLHKRRLDHYGINLNQTEDVAIETIDEFCTEKNIPKIDYLKLDTEGNELKCLQGAEKMIKNGEIEIIQFEFGGTNIDGGSYFQDFWYMLKDYDIFRIISNGLWKITHYSEYEEIFLAQNFLAIRKR